MASTRFAPILLVLPVATLIACGSSGGATTGTGGTTTTSSTGTTDVTSTGTTTSGTGGTTSTGTTTSGTTGTGGTASGTGGGSTASSSTSTSTGSTTTSSTSSTTSSTSGGTPGACTDAADEMVNMTTVGNDATGCVESLSCLGDYLNKNYTALATCVATCLENKDHITAGCGACWGTVVACGAENCASQCGGGQTAACTTCTDQFCTPAFNTCAGM